MEIVGPYSFEEERFTVTVTMHFFQVQQIPVTRIGKTLNVSLILAR